ncbi:MAG: hypothetical protein IJJ45_02910, partial [Clostridia bacterium]|nr:hypothetical protein [Clostridia bacterium]
EGARTRLSQAGRELDSAAAGVMPEDWTALDVSDAIAENAAQQKEQARALERAQADVERLDAIGIEQAAVAEAIRTAEAAVHAAELAGADLSAKRRKCGEDVDALRRELPFGTEAECRAAIREMEGEKQAIEGAVAAARDAVADLGQQIAGAKGALEKLEADLKGAPPMDADALEQAYREAQAACKAAAEREKAIHTRRANNDAQRRSLREQAGRAQALAHEYDVMQGVCNTIRGSGGGMHFPLETYVQTTYFDRIIDYANRRLYQMSRHQYDLVRREFGDGSGGGKKGLDLDVLDHANGKRRAVGTLSGGESFLASLSFALGMSDAIQASAASAVQIDTMFVDEGFGSLSESFLSLVMDELNATANTGRRLIGIISHVDEVKEGVERRIEVTKDHAGVSTARIY